jgi:hypothetical protein
MASQESTQLNHQLVRNTSRVTPVVQLDLVRGVGNEVPHVARRRRGGVKQNERTAAALIFAGSNEYGTTARLDERPRLIGDDDLHDLSVPPRRPRALVTYSLGG